MPGEKKRPPVALHLGWRHACRAALMAVAFVLLASTQGIGDTFTWEGDVDDGTGKQNWNESGNWSSATGLFPNSSTDIAKFDATSGPTSTTANLNTDVEVGQLRIINTATQAFNITGSGNTITMSGTGGIVLDPVSGGSATTTVNPNLAVTNTQTWDIGSGNTLRVTGTVSLDNLTMTRTGSGTLQLDNTLLLSGNAILAVSGGVTRINDQVTGTGDPAGGIQVGSGGTLIVNTPSSKSFDTLVLVKDGGTLGGTGTMGDILVKSGGTLAPGERNSSGNPLPGKLSTTGNVLLESGSTLAVQVEKSSNHDQLAVGGDIEISGATLNVTLFGTPDIPVGSTFTIITYGSGPSGGSLIGTFGNLPNNGDLYNVAGTDVVFAIDYLTSGEVRLITIVPEPGACALAAGAAAAFAFGCWRRVRRQVKASSVVPV